MDKCKIKTHIFLGCLKSAELNMHLNQSAIWKEEVTIQEQSLVEAHFEEKSYIGLIRPFSALTFEELKEMEKKARNQLQQYCPKLQVDKLTFYLFSQTFIS